MSKKHKVHSTEPKDENGWPIWSQPTEQEMKIVNQVSEEQLAENNEEIIALDGGATLAQPEEQSTEPVVEGEQQQPEEHSTEPEAVPEKFIVLGIGQFVRQMLLKSTKTDKEILELVLQVFPEAKTTSACISWYKSDLRKKGLLEGSKSRGPNKLVNFTPEMLANLLK